ncbi:hypothetical protein D3C86_2018040 [compost metagenome]
MLSLFICWLIFSGSWQQAVINLDVVAPASGLSMALFYGAGLVFGASAAVIIVYELYLVLFDKRGEDVNDVGETMKRTAQHGNPGSTRP